MSSQDSNDSNSDEEANKAANAEFQDDEQLPLFDENPSVPFATEITWRLTAAEVDAYMLNKNAKELNPNPPVNPKGGDVYLFSYRNSEPPDYRARCDQLFWHNDARRKFPGDNPRYWKTYFIAKLAKDEPRRTRDPDAFKRAEYRPISCTGTECIGLMHYLGDEKKASRRAHGNSQRERPFIRNRPIVDKQVKKEIHPLIGPKKTYENLKNQKIAPAGAESVALPRDRKQVANIIEGQRQKLRPTQDALYNLLMFMREGPLEFITDIDCKKNDLTVSCMLPDTMEIVEDCISEYPNERLVILYDTTFNLGEFYASAVIFRNTCLQENPVFPIAVLLHERKLADNHNRFMEEVFRQLPLQPDTRVVIITDREFDFAQIVPNSTHVFCWSHLLDNVKRKLTKNKLEVQNAIYDNFYSIIRSHTLAEAEAKANEFCKTWPEDFKDYFFVSIMPAIRRSGRWILHPLGLYSRISGVTTNASESFNNVIKSWTHWKEMPLDLAALAFYNLHQYYNIEYDRAKFGLGDFHFKPGIKLRPASEMPQRPSSILKPAGILDYIRYGNIAKQLPPKIQPPPLTGSKDVSASYRRAQYLLEQGAVDHVTKQKVFIIKEDDAKFMVSFEPNKCTCGAKACHHLIAARLSCNLSTNIKTSRNVTTLRRQDKRKISQKRPGRKQPRRDDYNDVNSRQNETIFEDEVEQHNFDDTQLECQDEATATSRSPTPTVESQPLTPMEFVQNNPDVLESSPARCLDYPTPCNEDPITSTQLEVQKSTAETVESKSPECNTASQWSNSVQWDTVIAQLADKALTNDETACDPIKSDAPTEEELLNEEIENTEDDTELPLDESIATATSRCTCGKITDEPMIECDAKLADCRIWYHRNCENVNDIYFGVKNKRKSIRSKLYWECSICFKVTRFRWGPVVKFGSRNCNIINSCNIDPALTSFYVQAKYNKDIWQQLPQELSVLKETLQCALANNFQNAVLRWVSFLRYTEKALPKTAIIETPETYSIDLYGDTEKLFFTYLRPLTKMERESNCNNDTCANKTSIQTSYDLTKLSHETMEDLIKRELRSKRQKCNYRSRQTSVKCGGQRTLHVPTMVTQLPLMLPPIFLCNAPYVALFDYPLEITLKRTIYQLGSILMHSVDHFACVLIRPGTSTPEYYICDDLEPVMLKTSRKDQGFAATAKRKLRRVLGARRKPRRPPSKEGSTEGSSGEASSNQPVLADLVDIESAFNRKDSHRGSIISIGRLSFMNDLQEEASRRTSEPEMENRGSLEWNPVDGMHAERQRNVSTLKNMFETRRHRSAKK